MRSLMVARGKGTTRSVSRSRATKLGATGARAVDARDEYARDFAFAALKMNALYQNRYPLVSALSRPLISRILIEVAEEVGADAVAHGCTGKGNDQVRFEVSSDQAGRDRRPSRRRAR